MTTYPALFLDRDGVIMENRASYVRSWADVEIFPQALAALALVRDSGFKIILVTNQSAVGRGIISIEQARHINDQLAEKVREANGRIDAIYLCPHAPQDNCTCRKPKPGMILQAASEHHLDLSRSTMIGDALTDLLAGQTAGIPHLILLKTGRGQEQLHKPERKKLRQFTIFPTLLQALSKISPTKKPGY
jgi:D-glycero-D-manno-heptose 1,7-bisphosphate phosphatase